MDIPFHLLFIFWFTFFGILHTLMPCEDKTIFAFYTFGVSRDSKEAFIILTMYGLGLLCSNMAIGTTVTLIGETLFAGIKQTVLNGYGALSIIVSGAYMFVKTFRKDYIPHPQQNEEIMETFQRKEGKFRKRSSFFLGILAGIPPCIFEFTVYSFAASTSGFYGIVTTFFFGIGTWIGLYALGIMGIGTYLAVSRTAEKTTGVNPRKVKGSYAKKQFLFHDRPVSKLEVLTSLAVIIIGVLLLATALLGINIYDWIVLPTPPT